MDERAQKHGPVLGFSGFSGSGKTTLITKLIPAWKRLAAREGKTPPRIVVIKHDMHGITGIRMPDPCETGTGKTRKQTLRENAKKDPAGSARYLDPPGKDSRRFLEAGAEQVILCGPDMIWESVREHSGGDPPEEKYVLRPLEKRQESQGISLQKALCHAKEADLILVEGFKGEAVPQVGLCREASGKSWTKDPDQFLAVVTDQKEQDALSRAGIRVFSFAETEKLARFLYEAL